jgi:hypothetical protein
MERLRTESSILQFRTSGNPPQRYLIDFMGKSLARQSGKVSIRTRHQVEIKLGASYPRSMPEIRWLSPIHHPNISEIGMVCLGGYGTHWVPSLRLDALCEMLWDMARYHNYDVRSPYNRDAALWVANQSVFKFPIDARPLRDVRASLGRIEESPTAIAEAEDPVEIVALPVGDPINAELPVTSSPPEELVLVLDDPVLRPMPPEAAPRRSPMVHSAELSEDILIILE